MAVFDSNLLGKVTKSVGNVTMCYTNRKNIAKAKVFKRKDNPTSDILDQRSKMKALVQLSRRLLAAIRMGFVRVGEGSTSNAFVKANMGAVSVNEEHVSTVNFEELLVASGLLDAPEVTATYDETGQSYEFKQESSVDEFSGALKDDKVYVVLFETVLQKMKIVMLRDRGEGGTTSYGLPKKWDSANVQAYCFATTRNGLQVSDSEYLVVE